MTASSMLAELADVGRDPTRGGYSRPVFSPAELELREWFVAEATRLGLDVETDRNGLIWAWWDVPGEPRTNAVATGSVLAAEAAARTVPGARATVGKLVPVPGGSNVIASTVDVWLDARHPDESTLAPLVEEITSQAHQLAIGAGCRSQVSCESYSPTARFDPDLTRRLTEVLPTAPLLDTGAGHDAGVLAPYTPSAMLFVRNPSGISHSPEEYAEDDDVDAGSHALAEVLRKLSTTV